MKEHPHNKLLQRLMSTDICFYGPAPVPVSFIPEGSQRGIFVPIPMPIIYCAGVPFGLGHTWMLEQNTEIRRLLRVTDRFTVYSHSAGISIREVVERFTNEYLHAIQPSGEQLASCLAFEAQLADLEEVPLRELPVARCKLSQIAAKLDGR